MVYTDLLFGPYIKNSGWHRMGHLRVPLDRWLICLNQTTRLGCIIRLGLNNEYWSRKCYILALRGISFDIFQRVHIHIRSILIFNQIPSPFFHLFVDLVVYMSIRIAEIHAWMISLWVLDDLRYLPVCEVFILFLSLFCFHLRWNLLFSTLNSVIFLLEESSFIVF